MMASSLALVFAMACPMSSRADVDGRAEWRLPVPPPSSTVSGSAPERADEPPLGAALGSSSVSAAPASDNARPALGPIASQALVAGRRWRLHLRAHDADGEPPRLLVRGLPREARVESRGDGWHVLEWTPPEGATGSVELTIIAVDVRDSRLRTERALRLELELPAGASAPAPSSSAAHSFLPPPLPPDGPSDPPRIEPLAAQVVSAGRTVVQQVSVVPEVDTMPLLWIDRLPRNASFDENLDGSRTFHWPTSEADQGEHRFRITAQHPDRAELVSHADLLVIVGDPTRSRTMPEDEMAPQAVPYHESSASPAPAFDEPAPPNELSDPSPEDEPFLPSGETGGFDAESLYPAGGAAQDGGEDAQSWDKEDAEYWDDEGAEFWDDEDAEVWDEDGGFESEDSYGEDPYFGSEAPRFDPDNGAVVVDDLSVAFGAPSPGTVDYCLEDGAKARPGYGDRGRALV